MPLCDVPTPGVSVSLHCEPAFNWVKCSAFLSKSLLSAKVHQISSKNLHLPLTVLEITACGNGMEFNHQSLSFAAGIACPEWTHIIIYLLCHFICLYCSPHGLQTVKFFYCLNCVGSRVPRKYFKKFWFSCRRDGISLRLSSIDTLMG